MKLCIIQPSHYRSSKDLRVHKTKKRSVVGLTLPYLAALTPNEWDVSCIDEQLMDIDYDAPVDLVAITAWTINSRWAYKIADRFRKRGVPVVMGGPHTYFYADEVAEHCDAVCIGEGEKIWSSMLADAASGRLKKVYRVQELHDLKGLPVPRYDLLNLRSYGLFTTFSVQTSRGCPFSCDFCSERFYLGQKYRYRPTDEVIEEIRRSKARNVFFADSNFAGKRSHTLELMEALIPLKLHWSALWSMDLCTNREFMQLAKRSGLLHVNLGMESIDQDTLNGMNKKANKASQYEESLTILRKMGISYSLNLIFGHDAEKPTVFDGTLEFLRRNQVPAAYFNILTPHKGTPLYERMEKEKRILDADNMGRWTGMNCYIEPKNCSPEQLENQVMRMYKEFYSLSSMFSRLPLPLTRANIASWVVNFSQRKMAFSDSMENFDNY
ncbi:MAG: radical SAM protein [Desulforhabdus sp.]|jgi:radical SAM superfamily enzyme YgiQ (UPF0313 family)|nr:radical SAM protein [Desulforhabdus sp.]